VTVFGLEYVECCVGDRCLVVFWSCLCRCYYICSMLDMSVMVVRELG